MDDSSPQQQLQDERRGLTFGQLTWETIEEAPALTDRAARVWGEIVEMAEAAERAADERSRVVVARMEARAARVAKKVERLLSAELLSAERRSVHAFEERVIERAIAAEALWALGPASEADVDECCVLCRDGPDAGRLYHAPFSCNCNIWYHSRCLGEYRVSTFGARYGFRCVQCRTSAFGRIRRLT
jgi:hypothetical protein